MYVLISAFQSPTCISAHAGTPCKAEERVYHARLSSNSAWPDADTTSASAVSTQTAVGIFACTEQQNDDRPVYLPHGVKAKRYEKKASED